MIVIICPSVPFARVNACAEPVVVNLVVPLTTLTAPAPLRAVVERAAPPEMVVRPVDVLNVPLDPEKSFEAVPLAVNPPVITDTPAKAVHVGLPAVVLVF